MRLYHEKVIVGLTVTVCHPRIKNSEKKNRLGESKRRAKVNHHPHCISLTTQHRSKTTMTSTQPPLPSFNLDNHVKQAWEFYHTTLHSPTNFAAPMVDQSELQYRLLTRRHNTHVCYTPMFHSRLMTEDVKYRQKVMYDLRCSDTTTSIDRPLLVQFCGNNPDTVLSAAKHVENHCDAVDLNLGCPQGIARKGNYGSFLMPETDLLVRIVQNLHSNLNIPVTCKIRLFPKIQDTIRLAKALESAGCYMLCIHGRTKEEKKMLTKETHFDEIRQVKQALRIPVISNGGVGSRNDGKFYNTNHTVVGHKGKTETRQTE